MTSILYSLSKIVLPAVVGLAALAAQAAAPALGRTSTAPLQTLEASVAGLNCALCSDQMRQSLKKATGATDLEPQLECGRIYFETDPSRSFNEAALTFALTANGFNLNGVRPVPETLAQLRAHKESC